MRDGSLQDIVDVWIDRMVEEHGSRNPGDNQASIYFALMQAAGLGLLRSHARSKPDIDYREELAGLVELVREGLGTPELAHDRNLNAGTEPTAKEREQDPARTWRHLAGEHASYWASDAWRKDFLDAFSRWFWDTKGYAAAAGRPKSDFLWDVAEVWVVAGAQALVYYAKDDRQRWYEAAQMLRHFADLTEADGLRSLPWGRWARHSPRNWRTRL
jgi:hypothetical protein